MSETKRRFTTGAVAIIDILGFKGIWKRHSFLDVIDVMKIMKEKLEAFGALDGHVLYNPAFLSDTVVFAMSCIEGTPHKIEGDVFGTCEMVSEITKIGALADVTLPFRGAIAYGDYYIESNFLIGPAIDEAAAAHQLAEGGIVWLTDRARHIAQGWISAFPPERPTLLKTNVPLKGLGTFQTLTASPIGAADDAEEARAMIDRLRSTYLGGGYSVELAVKWQNTEADLNGHFSARFPS